MNRQESFATGVLLGAGLMYLLDPDRGGRRRALVRDQLVHGGNRLQDEAEAAARDLRNRATGAVAEARGRATEGPVEDSVLEARVRSDIGRTVSNPGSVQVTARNGEVVLRGPVLASEVQELVSTARSVRGVRHVENELDVHSSRDDVPGLQNAQA